jgi:transcriptional regulator with XRE-family HTH domain
MFVKPQTPTFCWCFWPIWKPLRNRELPATIAGAMSERPSDRARVRIRLEMARKRLNQTQLAQLIGWTQSRMSKVLNGRTDLGVDDLADMCFGLSLSLVEVVRDHGMEWCAEMTPSEFRFLERLREIDMGTRDAFLRFIEVKIENARRHASPIKDKKIPRGRAASQDMQYRKSSR